MEYEIIMNQPLRYEIYEKIIMIRLIGFGLICTFAIVVGMICIIYFLKEMRREKKLEYYIMIFLCILLSIGSGILLLDLTYDSLYDVRNKAYIVWEGDFVVDSYKSSGSSILYIPDEKGIKLEMDAYTLRGGKYSGKVIYGEKTKYVFEIQVDEVTD